MRKMSSTSPAIATMEVQLYGESRELPADGGNRMSDFNVHYDEVEDILYLGREGQENEVVELSPGVNIELDDKGKLIGIELFKASKLLRDVVGLMGKKINQAA